MKLEKILKLTVDCDAIHPIVVKRRIALEMGQWELNESIYPGKLLRLRFMPTRI